MKSWAPCSDNLDMGREAGLQDTGASKIQEALRSTPNSRALITRTSNTAPSIYRIGRIDLQKHGVHVQHPEVGSV